MSLQPFHDHILPLFRGTLPDHQRERVDLIVNGGLARKRSIYDIAYVLATGFHESQRYLKDEEIGQGSGHPYGEPAPLYSGKSAVYYARGPVGLTWLGNYAKMSQIIGVDLVNHPEKAADWRLGAEIIWEGMLRGVFTGASLSDHIKPGAPDYHEARTIVNGHDRAEMIAGYAKTFEAGLELLEELPAAVCPCCGQPIDGAGHA